MRIYTDGSSAADGSGGWAWAVSPEGLIRGSGPAMETTNQRMEMTAALEALKSNPGDVTIVSDSRYVVDCFNKNWSKKWLQNGWLNSKGEPVANQDLWEALLETLTGRTVIFEWVKGHSIDPMNALVDRLAGSARTNKPIKEVKDLFEIGCNILYEWWKVGGTPTAEMVEKVEEFLVKMKLVD